MTSKVELVLGSGLNKKNKVSLGEKDWFDNPIFVDMYKALPETVVHNLEKHPLPFADDTFDEIHAYDVLEHLGNQGDWKFFFNEFNEYHRILKPDGLMYIIVPAWNSPWSWGDPGHRRVISKETFAYLNQKTIDYNREIGSPMTDYPMRKANFDLIFYRPFSSGTMLYKLQALKG